MTAADPQARELRMRASRLCLQLSVLPGRDPGERGYSQGMAERLRDNHWEVVTPEYVANLERVIRDAGREPVA